MTELMVAADRPDPAKSVFLNCPFDDDYRPIMDAIIFTIVCCGFHPRSALENSGVSVPRMERIAHCVLSSRYSIHDLSRCTGEGDRNLARFNMPLELGIAIGQSLRPAGDIDRHDWMLLIPETHPYVEFVSDLAGYDPKRYKNSPETAVTPVMAWLLSLPGGIGGLRPSQVLDHLPRFVAARDELEIEWGQDTPWRDIVLAARAAAP
jgi:hypothetical protein